MDTDSNRTYVIVSSSDLPQVNFEDVLEDQDYVRHSIDGRKVVLKYEGQAPASITSLTSTFYTHEEIRDIMIGPDWAPVEEPGLEY
tara:strand:+ start:17867 stop:18124 length:258 start_codon:yes stop_codon:yes gene_type:complete